jgi:hypothetical protein
MVGAHQARNVQLCNGIHPSGDAICCSCSSVSTSNQIRRRKKEKGSKEKKVSLFGR